MAIKELKTQKLTWVNIDQIDDDALKYLRDKHSFHHLDLEDIQGESQTPKLDTYKNYLFLVAQFPHWNTAAKEVTTHELNMFIGDGYLITIQHTKSKEMKNFFYRCMKNKRIKKEWMSSTSGYLVYSLLEALFKDARPILSKIGKQLSSLEEEIFAGQQDTDTVRELALHRRAVLAFRRIIDPQRYLISNLAHTRKPFLNEETSLYFDDINDHLNKMWAIVEGYKDSIQGLHTTVESLITQRTNKVIRTLTVISVGLLPFTVLAGIYGMNIEGLPGASDPSIIWMMFGSLALFVTLVLLIMRSRKWL
jgi:magnesium transporter